MSKNKYTAAQIQLAIDSWDHLVTTAFDFEDAIQKVIYNRTWEPIGYATFHEAWADKMSGITILSEMKSHVVYQLLSEGLSPEEVGGAVKGLGTKTASNFARERDSGVPASMARGVTPRSRRNMPADKVTVVKEHFRGEKSPDSFLHLQFTPAMKGEFDRIALKLGRSTQAIAKEAVLKRFAELA